MSVFPLAAEISSGPVSATTEINGRVVDAVGAIATPPVGEVDHYVTYYTELVEFLLPVLVVITNVVPNRNF